MAKPNPYNELVKCTFSYWNACNDKHVDGSRRLSYSKPGEIDPDDRAAIKFNVIRALQQANLTGEVAWVETDSPYIYYKLTIQVPA